MISFVANSVASGPNGGTTSAIDTTGANLLVVAVSAFNTEPLVANLSDNKGNTSWQALTANGTGNPRIRIFYHINPAVGAGHTVTFTKSSSFAVVMVQAFGGANTSSPFDVQNAAAFASTTTAQPGSVTPSENDEVVVTAINCGLSTTRSINSSFTITNQVGFSTGTNVGGAVAYKIQTTAAAENPTWSWSANDTGIATIATFKVASTAAAGNPWYYFAQQAAVAYP